MNSSPDWSELRRLVGARLIDVEPPLQACVADPDGSACAEELAALTNPFAIEDDAGAFHTTGWLNAFETRTGPLAVAAGSTDDVVAAVRFCAEQGLRVVAKGTGHDYLGRSSDPDALTVWTHRMRKVTVHDAFRPQGAGSAVAAVPAVSVGAGARWLEAYQAVQTHNRYVQGGGCTSVGVTGLTLGGGFGSFSRRFGTAAGSLLEAELVTASGAVLVVNDHSHPDLFWALRGGGFGLGVVTRLTLRTHTPPATLGAVQGTIKAHTDDGYRRLIRRLVEVFPSLCDDHWGEQVRFLADRSVEMALTAADVTESEANAIWEPFQSWVAGKPDEFRSDAFVVVLPFGSFWDRDSWDALAPEMIRHDERPDQPNQRFWWASNQGEVSQYLHAYQSRWLPARLLSDAPEQIAESLFQGAQRWPLSLHFNKALSGASSAAIARDRTTSINPAVFEAAALVLTASSQLDAFPRVAGHAPDLELAAERAARVTAAMAPIRAITPDAGSYVNETDYFEEDWQESFWGDNYDRLLRVKRRYDPDNLFRVHHGVGSEL